MKASITRALDDEVRAAYAKADYFTVTLFHGGRHIRHEVTSLPIAREIATLLPKAHGSNRRALVYVVTTDGNSVFIPEDFQP